MLNLLLKDQKKKIAKEYKIRFLIVACALILAGEIISLVLLTPSYLTVQTRISILNSESAGLKAQNLNTETSNLGSVVQQANVYLNALTSSTTPVGVVKVLQNIVNVRDGSIRIESLFYRTVSGKQQVVVVGKANSRQSLLDFATKLKAQPGVISADLPVSDFAKAQNIDFSINVVMNP